METTDKILCINCEYAVLLYKQITDRTTGERKYFLHKVECSKPAYKKRRYTVKSKTNCADYMKRERKSDVTLSV